MAMRSVIFLAFLIASTTARLIRDDDEYEIIDQQMDDSDIDQTNEIEPVDNGTLVYANDEEEALEGILEDPELFEGDIQNVNVTEFEGRVSINNPSRKWDKLVVPYVISNRYSQNARRVILNGMQQYHQRTCIKFVPRKNERDYIDIQPGQGCSSAVGRQGGRQVVSLGNGCVIVGIVVHELMHAVGFWHEQSRPDRDGYVTINWNNIPSNMKHNFMKFSHGQVDTLRLSYDIGSVMHYGPYDFAINRRIKTVVAKVASGEMGQRRGFSRLDVQKVNKLYRCNMAKRAYMDD